MDCVLVYLVYPGNRSMCLILIISFNIVQAIHGTCEVQDFIYFVSFANAMQALPGQNYNSFF